MKITLHLDHINPETDEQSDEVAFVFERLAVLVRNLGFGPLYSTPNVTISD